MPTIVRLGKIRVVIYPNDHRPAHVHAIRGREFSVFDLNCPKGPPELKEAHGFSETELRKVARFIEAHLELLCGNWRSIHGAY